MNESKIAPQLRREHPDPHEANNPIPALYLVFFGAVTAAGLLYLVDQKGGDFALSGDARSPLQTAAPAERSGATAYQTTCAACHQASGTGVPGAFPPLVSSPWLLESKETPIRIVLLGLHGKIAVGGLTYDGVMPAFGNQLSNGDIARILTHARTSWGNAASAITEGDVQRVRESLADRTEPWQGGAELQAIRPAPGP